MNVRFISCCINWYDSQGFQGQTKLWTIITFEIVIIYGFLVNVKETICFIVRFQNKRTHSSGYVKPKMLFKFSTVLFMKKEHHFRKYWHYWKIETFATKTINFLSYFEFWNLSHEADAITSFFFQITPRIMNCQHYIQMVFNRI